jgi:hypothetical protein
MTLVLKPEESNNSVSQQDVEVLIGVVATMTGRLMAGEVDTRTAEELAQRLVNAGLLDREPDGSLPSAGRVGLAMEDLVQRLRYAYGDYVDRPRPSPAVVAHVLALPSEKAALDCLAALPDGQVRDAIIRHSDTEGWVLIACYPELSPDRGFIEREATLRRTVTSHGGRYSGSQGAPQ